MTDAFRSKCQQIFKKADVDNSGTLTRFELCKVMQQVGCKTSIQELSDWFGNADRDGDEKMTFEEFWNELNKRDQKDVKEMELRSVFKGIDKDNSGSISAEELRASLAEHFPGSGDHVAEAIEKADKNHDGKIDYEEFLAEWRSGL